MTARPSDSEPLRTIWAAILALAPANQLDLFVRLREFLADAPPRSAVDDEIELRCRALVDLRRACDDLGVEYSAGLTGKRYDEAAARLGLISSSAVTRAVGSWRIALEVLAGRRVPQTAHQIDERRAAPRGTSRGDQLQMMRDFLATNPRAPTSAAYREWALEENRKLTPGQPRRLLAAAIIARSGGLRWSELIALARGEQVSDPADEDYPIFIALSQVARITGEAYTVVYRRGFPRPVAFSRHAQFWRRDDVLAYRDGREVAPSEPFGLQDEFLFTADIARLLGVSTRVVATRVRRAKWEVGLLPEPCAAAPNTPSLWWRQEVEEWIGRRTAQTDS